MGLDNTPHATLLWIRVYDTYGRVEPLSDVPYSELVHSGHTKENGQYGILGGRKKNCGLSLIEQLNQFAAVENPNGDFGLTENAARAICRDKEAGGLKRQAAGIWLSAMLRGDMADFEPLLDGQMSMRELRAQGVATDLIKKCKTKTRSIPNGDNPPMIEVEREIELTNTTGEALDRIFDQTNGKPMQQIQVQQTVEIRSITISYVGGDETPESGQNATLPDKVASTDAPGLTDGDADGH